MNTPQGPSGPIEEGMNEPLSDLVRAFLEKRAVLFISAGCSTGCGIPAAAQLAEQVALNAYSGSTGQTLDEFKSDRFGSVEPRLEEIADYYYAKEGTIEPFVKLIPIPEWRGTKQGESHDSIVRLAMEGFFDDVITTNWDVLIEAAASQATCSLAVVRTNEELAGSANAQLRLIKIHGCLTLPGSIIAATTQWNEPSHLWSQPQLEAAFQGKTVVFMGFSGSLESITKSMMHVAQWPGDTSHHVVDIAPWADFESRASDFVSATGLSEETYHESPTDDFLREISNRLIRHSVLELVASQGEAAYQELQTLAGDSPLGDYEAPNTFVEAIASADGARQVLDVALTAVDAYKPVNSNESLLARIVAWVVILKARGWREVDALPLMVGPNEEWVYFAGASPGSTASNAANRVTQVVRRRRDLRDLILGSGERSVVNCILLQTVGTASSVPDEDIVGGGILGSMSEITTPLRFLTEAEFIERLTA